MLTRRQLIARGAAGGAGLIALRGVPAALATGTPLARFVDPLPVPGNGWAIVDLRTPPAAGNPAATLPIHQFAVGVHRDLPPTRVWGYGVGPAGRTTYLGPTILTRRDLPVDVTFQNQLPATPLIPQDPAVVPNVPNAGLNRINTHLHGGHIAAASDGNPYHVFATAGAREVVPGGSQTLTYANDQPTAALFYHDHAIGVTRTNVYAGMAGAYVITDAQDPFAPEGSAAWNAGLRLPGLGYDIPLVLQDREFGSNNKAGQFVYPATWAPEFFGDTVLVNGKAWPYLRVQPRKYRFRIVNGSNSRFYNLSFGPGVTVWQIGSDLGRLAARVDATRTPLLVAPGERLDIVVDFSAARPGARIAVTDVALPGGTVSPTKPIGSILQFRVDLPLAAADASVVPQSLGGQDPAGALGTTVAKTRHMTLDEILGRGGKPVAALINNTHFMDMATGQLVTPVTEQPALGSVEEWRFINLTADTHPIHLHLVHFQVVGRRALGPAYAQRLAAARATNPSAVLAPTAAELGPLVAPPAGERGWKDTVRANPAEVTILRARFDRPGKFVYHCHILEHEENEMMRPFAVV